MHLVVGDIHGHVAALKTVVAESGVRLDRDHLILLGDYVDKGPHPGRVVEFIRSCKEAYPGHVVAVRGNHDDYYVRYARHLQRATEEPGYEVPMHPNDENLATFRDLGETRVSFLSTLPLRHYFEVNDERWTAVHAGLEPRDPDSDEKVLRIRYVDPASGRAKGLGPAFSVPPGTQYWAELYDGERNVVYGHHVHSRERPVETRAPRGQRLLSVDTGCGYDGILSAVSIETGEVWQSASDGTFLRKTRVSRI